MNEDEWISDYIFSHQKTGVKPRDLIHKSKMWGFNPKFIAKYVKGMLRLDTKGKSRLVKIKGRLFPGQDEFGRELQKVMYARKNKMNREAKEKVARELIKIAKDLTAGWTFDLDEEDGAKNYLDPRDLADGFKKGNVHVDLAQHVLHTLSKYNRQRLKEGKTIKTSREFQIKIHPRLRKYHELHPPILTFDIEVD